MNVNPPQTPAPKAQKPVPGDTTVVLVMVVLVVEAIVVVVVVGGSHTPLQVNLI
jgi:hypothetical protein